jgi:hypothetical protein
MTQDELLPGVDDDTRAGPKGIAQGVDWDAVKHDYLYSGMSQRRIAWRHRTPPTTCANIYKPAAGSAWLRWCGCRRGAW